MPPAIQQPVAGAPGVYMVKKNMQHSGSTIKLRLGDELHITVAVTNNYNYEWRDDGKHNKQVLRHHSNGSFIAILPSGFVGPKSPGEMTIVYKAFGLGSTQLNLKEAANTTYGQPSGLVWTANIEVRK